VYRTLTVAAALTLALASGAAAKSCKDPATGKSVKCPAEPAAPATTAPGVTTGADPRIVALEGSADLSSPDVSVRATENQFVIPTYPPLAPHR
jgi:hypothetical protein